LEVAGPPHCLRYLLRPILVCMTADIAPKDM
jgi:hypothetical protein